MREPLVVPMDRSPFDMSVSPAERFERGEALGDVDVVTDELGLMVSIRRQDDVEAMLTDPRFSAVAMPILQFSGVSDGPLHDLWSLLMFGKDGDEHHRLRATVAKPFRPKDVQQHREAVARFAGDLADRMAARDDGEAELWSDFAVPLASRVACHIVGIPEDDADQVGAWSIDLVNAFFLMDPAMRERAERAAVAFLGYLDGHLEAKRATPGDDVTSLLLAGTEPGAEHAHDLSNEEIRGLVANLVFGGLEATAKAVTTGVFTLMSEGQWEALVARPDLAPHAVAELLRFTPPVGAARLAGEEMVACDIPLHAGQIVVLDVVAACRDPRKYDRPDQLDIEREPGRQMAFGAGAHFCIGANVAKLTFEVALTTLATRFPSLRVGVPTWDHETFHGIVDLPVKLR